MKNLGILFIGLISSTFTFSIAAEFITPPANYSSTGYQRWAHYHWVWLHNGESNQGNLTDLVAGYQQHSIPVGAVNIDSMWATEFNNFKVDTKKFSDMKALITDLHSDNIKVILWATSMVNVENPDFEMCVKNNYLLRDSRGEVYPLKWWHGSGGLLDYSNPEAVTWWHSLMDNILDMGADGFKCDGTDPYVLEYSVTGGALGYNDQTISYKDYADMYYRDFLQHTRSRRGGGDAGLIMSRPVDCMLDSVTKLCWGYSPKDVVFSGWVGDDDASFNGLRGCMRKVIYSAWDGYANFGCDVGGYRGVAELNKPLFIRWTQAMSFLSLMENGGGGEHRPWMYDAETVEIYRKFVKEHHRLAHFFLDVGARAMESGSSSIAPLASRPTFYAPRETRGPSAGAEVGANFSALFHRLSFGASADEEQLTAPGMHAGSMRVSQYPQPSSLAYTIGGRLLVHPVLHDFESQNTSTSISAVEVTFPDVDGKSTVWLDWWKPHDASLAQKGGGAKAVMKIPLGSYPVFVACGAVIPLGLDGDDDTVVFHWFGPSATADEAHPAIFEMRQAASDGTGIAASFHVSKVEAAEGGAADSATLKGRISAHKGSGGAHIIGVSNPKDVSISALPGAGCRSLYDPVHSTLKLTCADMSGGIAFALNGVTLLLPPCA